MGRPAPRTTPPLRALGAVRRAAAASPLACAMSGWNHGRLLRAGRAGYGLALRRARLQPA
jgi:hypothetical protein